MSLDWDVREIKDHATITTHPTEPNKWHPVTEALVWLSLRCDFSSITEKNIDDVWLRITIEEKVFGPQMNGPDGYDWKIQYQDLVNHIGFRTNVGHKTTRQYLAKLNKRLVDMAERRAKDKPSCAATYLRMHTERNAVATAIEEIENGQY